MISQHLFTLSSSPLLPVQAVGAKRKRELEEEQEAAAASVREFLGKFAALPLGTSAAVSGQGQPQQQEALEAARQMLQVLEEQAKVNPALARMLEAC